jgi:hypothetical protein
MWESLKGRNLLEDGGVDVKIILKLFLNKGVLRMWAEFIFLSMKVYWRSLVRAVLNHQILLKVGTILKFISRKNMLPRVNYNLKQFYAKNIVLNVLSVYVFNYSLE